MLVAGLMSGTSADGIDVAIVNITGIGWRTRFQMRAFGSVPYPPAVRHRVLEIAGGAAVPAGEISQLNFLLGQLFADACKEVCRRARIPLKNLELIGSHGQTIYHQSRDTKYCGHSVRSTLQIAEPAIIAERTGVTTVADFRPADMAAGGQGAPLVPFFDYLLYRHPRRGRVVLNIGGIANITAIPAGGKPSQVIAFDTGPGNMVMDALVSMSTNGRLTYDRNGSLASKGTISQPLLRRLMSLPYLREAPPKSTGREQFGRAFVKQYFGNLMSSGGGATSVSDALATAAAFTARSIVAGIERFVLPRFHVRECIAAGGGVKNKFLMRTLRESLTELRTPQRSDELRNNMPQHINIALQLDEQTGLDPDAKEAVAFAVLAYQTSKGQPTSLPSATGARHPAVLGSITHLHNS
jgi:anhydro-N-acetylmuramic acid kinase